MEVRKRENETIGSMIFRFNKKMRQSGILKEVKKRRFTSRPLNRVKRKNAALYRAEKKRELERTRKYDITTSKTAR